MNRARPFRFPCPVYPIIDAAQAQRRSPLELAELLLDAGARLLQLRAKDLSARAFCELGRAVRERCDAAGAILIVNDRADVARLVGADGVHLGQTDLPPAEARRILGPEVLIGYSTHDLEQVRRAEALGCVDYLGFGPIFATSSKANPDPCQGVDGLRLARTATRLPLAAIGGIGSENAGAVLAAGADAVAVISALSAAEDPAAVFRLLGSGDQGPGTRGRGRI